MSDKVRVFGIYRTGWTDPAKAKFLERIVLTLYRRGAMTTGRLHDYIRASVHGDELFQEALKALCEWNLIEVTKRPWGIAHLAGNTQEGNEAAELSLTKTGEFHGMHSACDEQIASRG